jgi:hypothetical protein
MRWLWMLVLVGCAPATLVQQGPECATPKAAWIWCDDFEQDRLGSYFEYKDFNGRFLRQEQVGRNGSFGMAAHFQPGQQNIGVLHLAFGKTPQAYIRPVDDGTATYSQIYWRFYLRYDSTWAGGAGSKLTRAHSLVTANWAQGAVGHVWSSGGTNFLVLDPASGTDAAGIVRTTRYNDMARFRWLGQQIARQPMQPGQWQCYEFLMRLNTVGQEDGIFRMWLDGELQAQGVGLNWRGAYDAYGINAIFLENYWNAPKAQTRVFDNFVVSTEPIGCV